MPRHPFQPWLHKQCRETAGLTEEYVTELSYQTNTSMMWLIMTKGAQPALEYATGPDLNNLVNQVAGLLREGKRRLDQNRPLGYYVDTNTTLPDRLSKPAGQNPAPGSTP